MEFSYRLVLFDPSPVSLPSIPVFVPPPAVSPSTLMSYVSWYPPALIPESAFLSSHGLLSSFMTSFLPT